MIQFTSICEQKSAATKHSLSLWARVIHHYNLTVRKLDYITVQLGKYSLTSTAALSHINFCTFKRFEDNLLLLLFPIEKQECNYSEKSSNQFEI